MELILSNFRPIRTSYREFYETFIELLHRADELKIAVGYVSAESLMELRRIAELNRKKIILIIGVHYFDKFTRREYEAANNLDEFLTEHDLGNVLICNGTRFHGKQYVFYNSNVPIAGITGSFNLSSILINHRLYESGGYTEEEEDLVQMGDFFSMLSDSTCTNIRDLTITDFRDPGNFLLDNIDDVDKLNNEEQTYYWGRGTGTTFLLPLKAGPDQSRSNLNVFFGIGRRDSRGYIRPRPWYETELIVPREITRHPDYPQSDSPESSFFVITDDGYKFRCLISGQNSKNFRSEGDLTTLGKWIKGRLEQRNILRVGEPITNEMLDQYGRTELEFTKTSLPNHWLLNFRGRE